MNAENFLVLSCIFSLVTVCLAVGIAPQFARVIGISDIMLICWAIISWFKSFPHHSFRSR